MTMRGVGAINEAEKQTEGVVMKYDGNGHMEWKGVEAQGVKRCCKGDGIG